MKHKLRSPRFPSFWPEGLESRGLLATGMASGLNVVMELGEVSRSAALEGVEVAAPIASHGSITFVFETEAAGNYLLKVRHIGEGLTLKAQGPSGSASIDPGPAGPFETLSLPLKAAEYRITASAVGNNPVFVDWELLLSSGVSQSAAISPTLAATSVALPPSAAPASTLASPSPSAAPTSRVQAVSPSVVTVGGLAGRLEPVQAIAPVGPTSRDGSPALAIAGNDLPVGALKALVPVDTEAEAPTSPEPTSLLTLELLGNARQDQEALATPKWLDPLVNLPLAAPPPEVAPGSPAGREGVAANRGFAAALAAEEALDESSDGTTTLAASPGLIATGLLIASVARRWRKGRGLLPRRPNSSRRSDNLPESMG